MIQRMEKTLGVMVLALSALLMPASMALAAAPAGKPVLSDVKLLQAIGAKILAQDSELGVGYAKLNEEEQQKLSRKSHEWGRCAGFEALPESRLFSQDPARLFDGLRVMAKKDKAYQASRFHATRISRRSEIEAALKQVNENNLEGWVKWFSSFTTRDHRSNLANVFVDQLKAKIDGMVRRSRVPVTVDLIQHSRTKQRSIRIHIQGSKRADEIVVMGGHLDSINQEWEEEAPGADDNASGSADMLEALRILLTQAQPERSVEIFLYAGEEGGLLGSAEIARDYAKQKKNVIGALQLDMTLFPGSGEFVLGSMTDFTSAWLRDYFYKLNQAYIGAKVVEDKCGYGCSDHASWYRNQYPSLMPFEATFSGMNHNLHTARDKIDEKSSFRHSAMFAKIAVAFAMDLANSTEHQP